MYQDHAEVKVMLALYLPVVEIRRGYYGNLVVRLLDMLITLSVYVFVFFAIERCFIMAIMVHAG